MLASGAGAWRLLLTSRPYYYPIRSKVPYSLLPSSPDSRSPFFSRSLYFFHSTLKYYLILECVLVHFLRSPSSARALVSPIHPPSYDLSLKSSSQNPHTPITLPIAPLQIFRPPYAVVASPIRVVVTEVSSTGVRYGHATADTAALPFTGHPIELLNAPAVNSDALPTHRRPGCQGMRSKALEASNALRQWLGLEPIKPNQGGPRIHHAHHMSGEHPVVAKFSDGNKTGQEGDIPVLPFVGTPVRPAFVPEGEDRWSGPRPMWVHRHQHFRGSFLRRVHHALMSLGPWEGRAVAFVLGTFFHPPYLHPSYPPIFSPPRATPSTSPLAYVCMLLRSILFLIHPIAIVAAVLIISV